MAHSIVGLSSSGRFDWNELVSTIDLQGASDCGVTLFPIPSENDHEVDALGISASDIQDDEARALRQWRALLDLIERLEREHGVLFVDLYSGDEFSSQDPSPLREALTPPRARLLWAEELGGESGPSLSGPSPG